MSSHVITPGPYRATKLWNEVTRLFRAGMPLRRHRVNFRHHSSCFTASAAVDWLHELLRNNSNFGPDVTRQQTVQLLKKFLKNHVIEDVKGRWGSEDLEDNGALYRFPSTSPLKPIPCPAPRSTPGSVKKRPSLRDRDGFFSFRSAKKHDKETLENVDPAYSAQREAPPADEEQQQQEAQQRRELTAEDEQDVWRDITLTHLQRILGVSSLSEVLDPRHINPQNIVHNMTKVNKHGVVALDDKTNDLPPWVLSAMKSLANWPRFDSEQPSYSGFERDVFKTVSDYFHSLPQPLLTYELYELFINVLVLSGHVAPPTAHQLGKRKNPEPPCAAPPPAKSSFRSTECLLLSLLRQRTCDEAESPMRDVIGGRLRSRRLAALQAGPGGQLGGSCLSLGAAAAPPRPPARCSSLETILDDSACVARQQLFLSSDSLASGSHSNGGSAVTTPVSAAVGGARDRLSAAPAAGPRSRPSRPRSVGSCLDIVVETEEEAAPEMTWRSRAASCLDVNAAAAAPRPPSLSSIGRPLAASCLPLAAPSSSTPDAAGAGVGPRPASSAANLRALPPHAAVRRCLSSLDVSKLPRPAALFRAPPARRSQPPPHKPEHSVLRPQCERVAVEALQLCTLLLPPASRKKLQLLMRMMSRISQNVDMPRLHPAIGTRTLMVHTFSACVLGSAEDGDLDELLATRLVSFLMDHQHSILSVPAFLRGAIADHIQYLRMVQVPVSSVSRPEADDGGGGEAACVPMPVYAFCHQISSAEFEQQKLEASQKAMEELLDFLLTDAKLSDRERHKKLKQFQKQYPDIYRRRVPPADSKPKIKPPLLSIKRTKVFSIRN